MEFLKFVLGFGVGAGAFWFAVWLVFIYPYSDVSLKWLWIGLASGCSLAIVAVGAVLWFWSQAWPGD